MAQQAPSCRCVHSKCLKLYCVCFTRGVKFGFILCLLFFFSWAFRCKIPVFSFPGDVHRYLQMPVLPQQSRCRGRSEVGCEKSSQKKTRLLPTEGKDIFLFSALQQEKMEVLLCLFYTSVFFLGGVTDFSRSVQLRPISMYEEILPVLQCERTMYRCVPLLSLPKSLKKK